MRESTFLAIFQWIMIAALIYFCAWNLYAALWPTSPYRKARLLHRKASEEYDKFMADREMRNKESK